MFETKAICRNCKNEFEVSPYFTSICPRCTYESDDEYNLVRHFIRDNPGLTASQVSSATGVKVSKILKYLRENLIDTK